MLPDSEDEEPPAGPDTTEPKARRPFLGRVVALLEVIICSDYPTQFAIAGTFAAFGWRPLTAAGDLSVAYVVTLSLADTALLLGLVLVFLRAHGESPREVFLGRRPARGEAILGLPLIVVALGIGLGILTLIQLYLPALHTVPQNPLEEMIRRPRDAALFSVVVVVAGGVREELERAFLLHRFEDWLGGGAVGVVVTSVAFGGGHFIQGVDAAITTGALGAFWGIVYLRRRSSVAPMVSHSGFNLMQIVQFLVIGR
ncbi:MAG: CPBP family intramembrane glutamic endopeptidase [Betaproteobacteria bacterium]